MRNGRVHVAAQYHHAYLDVVKRHTQPAYLLAWLILEKLREQGIDGTDHFEAIKEKAVACLAADPESDTLTIELELPGLNLRKASVQIVSDDLSKVAGRFSEVTESACQELFASFTDSALRSVLEDPEVRLLHLSTERDAFVRRLEQTWSEPFKLLDILVELCSEVGDARNSMLRKNRRRSKDFVVVDVLTRLHGRSLTVAREVQILLRNGFADGALSRWRTLHELVVISMFILQSGEDAAIRFSAHVDADSIKAARQFRKFAPLLGYRQIAKKEQARLDALEAELTQRFGKDFLGDYGWAALALNYPRPTFAAIEEAVDLDKFRPYFRLASNTVHAGAKGTYFSLGIVDDRDVILAGASNAGLEEAGRLLALSLTQITMNLLMVHPNTDSIVWGA